MYGIALTRQKTSKNHINISCFLSKKRYAFIILKVEKDNNNTCMVFNRGLEVGQNF